MNGIKFGNIRSFEDLNLILSSVNIEPATPKTTYIDVPGADGSLDLTEALGEVKFNDRKATFVFTTLPEDDVCEKYSQVCNALNGVRFSKITLEKDIDWYWTGRCSVSNYENAYPISKITVTATLNPWKRKQDETIINDSLSTTYKTIILPNSRKHVVPEITVSAETKIKIGATETTISTGTHTILNLSLVEGINSIQAKTTSGTGTIQLTYREGEL